MSELERVETGLGEECGVFGAYDMDGGQCTMVCLPFSTEGRKAAELQ